MGKGLLDVARGAYGTVTDSVGTAEGLAEHISIICSVAAQPVDAYNAVLDAMGDLGADDSMETMGNAGGQVIGAYARARAAQSVAHFAKRGDEISLGKNCRIAPFGNRAGHRIGRFTHYHRRIPDLRRPGHAGDKTPQTVGEKKDR